MTSVIAIGKKGKNIVFELKKQAMAFFDLKWTELDRLIKSGKPVLDPNTDEVYYLDDLVDETCEPEEEPKKCVKQPEPWQDWD